MSAFDLAQHIFSLLPRVSQRGAPSTLLAVPAHGAPRWLLPQDTSSATAVLASWSPYRLSSRVQWHGIRAANRMRMLNRVPGVEIVRLPEMSDVDWRALGWSARDLPEVAVYIGTRGPTQKAVIHLVNRKSRSCEAIVKVSLGPQAANAIVREAETLVALAAKNYPHAPRLLSLDRERGIATQQFIAGRPGSRRLRPEYVALLRSLVYTDTPTSLAEHAAALQQVCTENAIPDVDFLRSALAALDDDRSIPSCCVHGDFAPWNIRRSSNAPPVLIDWEEAKPAGLPLHDACHFLHIQDFLFGHKPRLHANALAEFGRHVGLNVSQCRSLEIAYLAQTYIACRSRGDRMRSDFLLRALTLVLRDRAHQRVFLPAPACTASTTPVGSDEQRARKELLDSLIANLNHAGVSYCVLSGHNAAPGNGTPDLDIMVSAQDRPRIPEMLARTSQSTGALLVQAIQHETTATFYILARHSGDRVVHLDVDCYTDYRKDGRTWLPAHAILHHRREYRGFYVPSVADEFAYYLLKKVLKQSVTPHQLKQLQHLLVREPEACRSRVARFWPDRALNLLRAIAEQDFHGFRQQLPELYSELQALQPHSNWRSQQRLRELGRRARRIMAPTGMWIAISGSNLDQRVWLAHELAQRLAPTFRCASILPLHASAKALKKALTIIAARIRSTLVLSATDQHWRAEGLLLAPDLRIELDSAHPWVAREPGSGRAVMISAEDPEQVVRGACDAVLAFLADRARKRLHMPGSSLPLWAREPRDRDLSAAGSD